MKWTDDKLDILQNLEFAIANFWRSHRELTDYGAGLIYEASFQHYRAEARGHLPKPPALSALELGGFEALREMCEFRLGRASLPGKEPEKIKGIPLELLLDCLRELRKSIERHTQLGGRQGYLQFIEPYLR